VREGHDFCRAARLVSEMLVASRESDKRWGSVREPKEEREEEWANERL